MWAVATTEYVVPTPQAAACIAPTEARFTFPPEPAREVTWNAPGPAREDGRPEYWWQVYWILNWGDYGKRPHAIWALKRWASTGQQHGTVKDLLSQTPVLVMTSDTTPGIDLPISQGLENPAVVSTVEHRQVALVVRGRGAVQQIFPTPPDSVHLLRRRGTEVREEEIVIPVAHANRSCRPDFLTLPVNLIRKHHRHDDAWEKFYTRGLDLSVYGDEQGFELIAQALDIPYPEKATRVP
jgi:hypothetical protein